MKSNQRQIYLTLIAFFVLGNRRSSCISEYFAYFCLLVRGMCGIGDRLWADAAAEVLKLVG